MELDEPGEIGQLMEKAGVIRVQVAGRAAWPRRLRAAAGRTRVGAEKVLDYRQHVPGEPYIPTPRSSMLCRPYRVS